MNCSEWNRGFYPSDHGLWKENQQAKGLVAVSFIDQVLDKYGCRCHTANSHLADRVPTAMLDCGCLVCDDGLETIYSAAQGQGYFGKCLFCGVASSLRYACFSSDASYLQRIEASILLTAGGLRLENYSCVGWTSVWEDIGCGDLPSNDELWRGEHGAGLQPNSAAARPVRYDLSSDDGERMVYGIDLTDEEDGDLQAPPQSSDDRPSLEMPAFCSPSIGESHRSVKIGILPEDVDIDETSREDGKEQTSNVLQADHHLPSDVCIEAAVGGDPHDAGLQEVKSLESSSFHSVPFEEDNNK